MMKAWSIVHFSFALFHQLTCESVYSEFPPSIIMSPFSNSGTYQIHDTKGKMHIDSPFGHSKNQDQNLNAMANDCFGFLKKQNIYVYI